MYRPTTYNTIYISIPISRNFVFSQNKGFWLLLLLFFLVLKSTTIQAQGWEWGQSYGNQGNENINGITTLSNHKIGITGTFSNTITFNTSSYTSHGLDDGFVALLDSLGNPLWSLQYGSASSEEASSIVTLPDNSLAATGSFWDAVTFGDSSFSTTGSAMFLARLSEQGKVLWSTLATGNGIKNSSDLVGDSQGNIYWTGYFGGNLSIDTFQLQAAGSLDVFLIKIDTAGVVQWVQTYGQAGSSRGISLAYSTQGDLVLGGIFDDTLTIGTTTITANTNDEDLYITSLNPHTGTPNWVKKIGGNSDAFLRELTTDANGNIYLTGYYRNVLFFDNITIQTVGFDNDIFAACLTNTGQIQWAKGYGAIKDDFAEAIAIQGNQLFIGGSFFETTDIGNFTLNTSHATSMDAMVIQLDLNGTPNWVKQISGEGFEVVQKVHPTSQNQTLIAGTFTNFAQLDATTLAAVDGFDIFISQLNMILTSTQAPVLPPTTISVYPNPATDVLILKNAPPTFQYLLTNSLGQVVDEGFSTTPTLSITHLPKGLYQISLLLNGQVVSFSFWKW